MTRLAVQYAEPAFRSIAWRGRYLVIGFANGEIPALPLNLPLLKGASVIGVFFGDYVKRELPNFTTDLAEMLDLTNSGQLNPHISARYRLEDGARGLQDLLERKVTGKVILVNE
jgi:NADPH2:quinone reductase